MHRYLRLAILLLCAASPASARPVVLELFTSQSCSSCPPADALLASLARTRDDVLALDFHVDYWNYLNWHDRFSTPEATSRQRAYSVILGSEVYTPQLVIDGQRQAVGSSLNDVLQAIAAARAAVPNGTLETPSVNLAPLGDAISVDIGNGGGSAEILLIGFDSQHVTEIGSGENAGRVLREVNVVRSLVSIGHWQGHALHTQAARSAGEHHAVLVQSPNGKIIGVATL